MTHIYSQTCLDYRQTCLDALQRFRQILRRRNALLKDGQSGAVVMAFDRGLVESGARVVQARRAWIEGRSSTFREYYRSVSGGVAAVMRYRSSFHVDGAGAADDVATAYRDALVASSDRERRSGTTVVGPHRDELRLLLDGENGDLDLREFGSGGQRRTAALALRLAEAQTIRDTRRQEPVILLDDVFAELDAGRSERVLELMEREETGQVIVTAPKERDVRLRRDRLPRWRIREGRVRA